MHPLLIDHALKNVVCAPEQDSQFTFKPNRITAKNGVISHVDVEWKRVPLPTKQGRYHVYQIGDVSNSTLGNLPIKNSWVSIKELMESDLSVITAYDGNGRVQSKLTTYLRITATGNLIVAVEELLPIPSVGDSDFYIRFYKNAFFASSRNVSQSNRILTNAITSYSRADTVTFQNEIASLVGVNEDNIKLFQNGWLVDNFFPDLVALGDVLEYVVDTSIKAKRVLKVSEIDTFTSTLDLIKKYLLEGELGNLDTINFRDDIDLYISGMVDGRRQGLYYHKSSVKSMRMVTHNHYSIPVSNLTTLVNSVSEFSSIVDLEITLFIRHGGLDRKLISNATKLKELMLLPPKDLNNVLLGRLSNMSLWEASRLEADIYPLVMDAINGQVTYADVTDLYGYDAVSMLIGNVEGKIDIYNGLRGVVQPIGLMDQSTVFEYDVQGLLIGFYPNTDGEIYRVKNAATVHVETFYGLGGNSSGIRYNESCTVLNGVKPFIPYKCNLVQGVPLYDWVEAVEREDYIYVNDEITWLVDFNTTYTAVKTGSNFLCKTEVVNNAVGVISIHVQGNDIEFQGEISTVKDMDLTIPPERVDVFLNGHVLVEKFDYLVDWPVITILNKEYLNANELTQTVTYRCHGFCDSNLKYVSKGDFGFVKNGLLSNNNVYDVRQDRNYTLSVGGRVLTTEDILFDETNSGIKSDLLVEGAPYQIRDVFTPVERFVLSDTREYRTKMDAINERVSDYLSAYLPKVDSLYLGDIPNKHVLISPFIARVNYLLASGILKPELNTYGYTHEYVRSLLRDQEYLLAYEPLVRIQDKQMFVVHPHQYETITTLSYDNYIFLKTAIDVYLAGKVDISNFIQIRN